MIRLVSRKRRSRRIFAEDENLHHDIGSDTSDFANFRPIANALRMNVSQSYQVFLHVLGEFGDSSQILHRTRVEVDAWRLNSNSFAFIVCIFS